jgi:hypothetical protein
MYSETLNEHLLSFKERSPPNKKVPANNSSLSRTQTFKPCSSPLPIQKKEIACHMTEMELSGCASTPYIGMTPPSHSANIWSRNSHGHEIWHAETLAYLLHWIHISQNDANICPNMVTKFAILFIKTRTTVMPTKVKGKYAIVLPYTWANISHQN